MFKTANIKLLVTLEMRIRNNMIACAKINDIFQYDNTKSLVGVNHKQSFLKNKRKIKLTYLKISYYLTMLHVINGRVRIRYKTIIQGHTSNSIKIIASKLPAKFHIYTFVFTRTKELEFTGKEQNWKILAVV